MSPAAADIHSPLTSSPQPKTSSSIQNTSAGPQSTFYSPFNPTAFTSTDFSESGQRLNSSTADNASACGFPSSFTSSDKLRTGSTRSRPRLVKVRKQSGLQQARSRRASAEVIGGFNPFCSVSESSDRVAGGISSSNGINVSSGDVENGGCAGNAFSFSNCETKLGKGGFAFDNKGFKFSTNADSGRRQARDYVDRKKETVENEIGSRKIENKGFIFSAKRSDIKSNCFPVKCQASENAESSGLDGEEEKRIKVEVESAKWENPCFIFGANQRESHCSTLNSKTETISSRHTTGCNVASGLNSETKAFDDNLGSSGSDSKGKLEVEGETENGKVDKTATKLNANRRGCGFVFQSNKNETCVSILQSSKKGPEEMLQCENVKSSDGNSNTSNIDGKSKNVFVSSCNMASSYSKTTDYKLSEAMEELKIKDSEKFSSASRCRHLNKNSCEDTGAAHAFTSREEAPCSSDASTENVFPALNEEKDHRGGTKMSSVEFKPPNWDPSYFKENLFPGLNEKKDLNLKSKPSKEKGSKNMRRKLKPNFPARKPMQEHLAKESGVVGNPDIDSFSPMDFSPYQSAADDQFFREEDASSNASSILGQHHVPTALYSKIPQDGKGESMVANGVGADNSESDHRCGDPDEGIFQFHSGSSCFNDCNFSGPEIPCYSSKTEHVHGNTDDGIASIEDRAHFSPDTNSNGLEDKKENNFTFSASSSAQDASPSIKHKYKKKSRRNVGCSSFIITPTSDVELGSSSFQFSSIAGVPSHADAIGRSETQNQLKQGDLASLVSIEEICDKWRLRGNKAYENGDLSKAEENYTHGIKSASSSKRSGNYLKPLLLCHSNRAATRMALGRIREAIGDCMMATALDPTFLKVQMRAAKCHLILGEVENAQLYFNKFLESGNGICLDRRLIVEAANGFRESQKVAEFITHSSELLEQRTFEATLSALELTTKALSISVYSEKLLRIKAEALCLLQRYNEAIQLCENSRVLAEQNFSSTDALENVNDSGCQGNLDVRLWRWSIISRCYFYLGRLEASLDVLEKLEQDGSAKDKCGAKNVEMSHLRAAAVRELLSQKNAGNKAFKSGKYEEAVEHYTAALAINIKSRPFAAICFCNRAAAHQALGSITDAISDCSLAIALDGTYAKAISRRATLHEMVRDYGQAASDLKRLIALLENQSEEKAMQSSSPGHLNSCAKESRQAHRQLLSVEKQAKNEIPLDMYLILGIKKSDKAADVKKAYHKAALRHHPDKAGQLLVRGEIGDEGQQWKDICQEVHKDADRLFKMIGEAYAVLSDPAKRSEYDLEEEIQKSPKPRNGDGTHGRSSDFYGYGGSHSEGGASRREKWKTHGNSYSYSRW